ncbi:hypothetical protein HMPREF0591_6442 [Mycobacterium parascrofulaceum ATCC BAA-614]|uniref:Uncharacterized protein n=1 Tax=Mycobacterium parascrofulaceum ATCC BAA-614 TaxID=525368 RepID=D5PJU8_9MYCO|nr:MULTISPECIES: hypothetical protein [Mycobacterium]EFG73661.1 hypothetical protein HMPREF0591_6442 [Mycobacterium parascrofulaceum ATCC BAA-614]OCB46087.1 hypothetical protein A9X02_14040 [Mycobacterium malmoense]
MVRQEGGRWDVGIKDKAVYLERVSDGDERVFDDSLDSGEARKLAELLTKFADKLDNDDEEEDEDGDGEDEDDEDDEGDADAEDEGSEDSERH